MSNYLLKPALAAGIAIAALAAPVVATPALAQTAPAAAPAPQKIGIVNVDAVIANSNAYKTAAQQRQTTYASQIAQANSRKQAIEAQIKPMVDAFNAERAKPSPNQTTLQQKAQQIQEMQQQGQAELQRILRPVSLSQAYVEEQIRDKLEQAIDNAAKAANVTLVMSPDNVLYATNDYNLNQSVLDQLNTLIPAAQLIPPQGWLPRQMREQQQAEEQASQPQAQPGAPSGR